MVVAVAGVVLAVAVVPSGVADVDVPNKFVLEEPNVFKELGKVSETLGLARLPPAEAVAVRTFDVEDSGIEKPVLDLVGSLVEAENVVRVGVKAVVVGVGAVVEAVETFPNE